MKLHGTPHHLTPQVTPLGSNDSDKPDFQTGLGSYASL